MTRAEKTAEKNRRAARNAAGIRETLSGKCPRCGTELTRNLSFFFWMQCGAYGTQRKPEHRGLPACSYQSPVLDRESYVEANALLEVTS